MSETAPENPGNFSKENITNVLTMSRAIKPLIDYDADDARDKTKEFLDKVFPGAGFTDFGVVLDKINDPSLGEKTKEVLKARAEMVGAATLIAGGNDIYKWVADTDVSSHVAEGMGRVSEVLMNNLFVRGENDEVGKNIVTGLIQAEKIKQKYPDNNSGFRKKRSEKIGEVEGKLLNVYDGVDDPDSEDAEKLSVVIGYLDEGLITSENIDSVNKPDVEDGKFREDANELLLEMLKKIGVGVDIPLEEFVPEGVDAITGETRESKYYSRMDITAELLAVSMKLMDPNGARFDSYRPTEWYKKMTEEQRNVVDVMIEVNMAASATYYYGKDLDKLLGSKVNFSFTSEKMRTLFDDKTKLVLSKMFNDLCETYTDQNLHTSMRYKEGFYAIPNKKDKTLIYSDDEERYVLAEGREIDEDGFLLGADGKRIVLLETEENVRGGLGKRGITGEVMAKLRMIENYKEEMAYFLAEQTDGFMKYHKDDKEGHKKGDLMKDSKGKFVPNPLCKMYAYTAWNLWYGMGDSSLADRMRFLPTWDKIVNDGIRTTNGEYKLYSKLMVFKSGAEKEPSDLDEAELFTGKMGDYVFQVMDQERKLAEAKGLKGELPLKEGNKTMRRKILDGDISLLPDKTMYGFFDFVNGGRDLVQVGSEKKFYEKNIAGSTTKKTLGQFLMDYAYTDTLDKGRVLIDNPSKRRDFNFKKDQVTFMNEFADSLQAAILYNGYVMGKADVKDPMAWALAVKSAKGMVNGIKFNGEGYFKYIKSPEMWRAMIVGCYGADTTRLSSDYIPIIPPPRKTKSDFKYPYSFAVHDMLVGVFGLTSDKVNIPRLMQLLGVDVRKGQNPRGDLVKNQTYFLERRDRERTKDQNNLIRRKTEYVVKRSLGGITENDLRRDFSGFNEKYKNVADFAILRASFNRAINANDLPEAKKVLDTIKTKTF